MHIHWLIYGHMTSNQNIMSMSRQHLQKWATFLTIEGNRALLPAFPHDQTMIKGGMIMMQLMFTLSAWRFFKLFFSTMKKAA